MNPRSWCVGLFVPGDRPELASKAAASGADFVILDLEDAVAESAKAGARANLAAIVDELGASVALTVRTNSPGSAHFAADLAATSAVDLAALLVPKWTPADRVETRHPVIAGIESVSAVLDMSLVGLAGVYFGAEDYVRDLDGIRTSSNEEVLVARSLVAMRARAAAIPAFDMVTTDFRDDDRVSNEARQARALGYSGKLCIHPRQVPLVRAGFAPTDVEIARAREIIAAFTASGGAAVALGGEMIDEVVARRAEALLSRAGLDNS